MDLFDDLLGDINVQSDVCLGLFDSAASAIFMPFTSSVHSILLLHVRHNTGSLPVFMTSSTAQTTGSPLDVGHGNSCRSHSRCGNVNVGAIPCS